MALKTTAGTHGEAIKGRGASINLEGRFEHWNREASDDGWFQEPADEPLPLKTVIYAEHAKSVLSRHDSPDVGFAQSINPYRGCSHGCSYCIHGDTLLLMGDGRTKPISEVRVGDEIYGTTFDGKYRRFTRTKVLDHWSSIKPAYRTTLQDGTELISSGDHRFLTERGWKYVANNPAGETQRAHLTTNNELLGTGQFAEGPCEDDHYRRGYLCGMIRGDGTIGTYQCQPRSGGGSRVEVFRLALSDAPALLRSQDYLLDFDIPTHELQFTVGSDIHRPIHAIRTQAGSRVDAVRRLIEWPRLPSDQWCKGYLAGVFDAEGSFSQTVLRICNTNPEILDWIRRCFNRFGFRFVDEARSPEPGRKPVTVIRMVGGLKEHLRFFHLVRPAITRKLDLENQAIKSDAKLKVASIEPLGRAMRLYDISTGTEDFIANGVVSHNCYARPSHAYLGLSPGLDFETRLSSKVNAAAKLREEISKPGYRCEPIAIGMNTDAYQPIERTEKITRSIIEVAHETDHPISFVTKSALIERDLDLLAPMAAKRLVSVTFSITTLDNDISRLMQPRASAPGRLLLAVKRMTEAGIPVNVNVAPVVPFLTDAELESILEAGRAAGAISASYILVRLPWEVRPIFKDWLEKHFPLKAAHVMSRIREMRDGKENDPNFGSRMSGTGLFAQLLAQRFEKACARLGLRDREGAFDLDCSLFRKPSTAGQGSLF